MSDDERHHDLRGVILAGGKGTRLGALTKVTNKHLLPVGPEPMVYHPLKKLVGAGIRDILLVSGTEHMGDFVELLGSGKDYGCELTYRVQDEAGGIAQALGLARAVLPRRAPAVILGDNIFEDSLAPFATGRPPAADRRRVLVKQVADPGPLRRRRVIDGNRVVRHRGEAERAARATWPSPASTSTTRRSSTSSPA